MQRQRFWFWWFALSRKTARPFYCVFFFFPSSFSLHLPTPSSCEPRCAASLACNTCHFLLVVSQEIKKLRQKSSFAGKAHTTTTLFISEPISSIMPVELRKRKAPVAPPAPAPTKKKAATNRGRKPAASKAKEDAKKPEPEADKKKPAKDEEATDSAPEDAAAAPEGEEKDAKDKEKKPAAAGKVAVGDVVDLEGFGGEIQTNDGDKTTLKKLVDDSKSGVVLFTYPKASTPGCKFFTFFASFFLLPLYNFHDTCLYMCTCTVHRPSPCPSRAFIRVFPPVYTHSRRDWHVTDFPNHQAPPKCASSATRMSL